MSRGYDCFQVHQEIGPNPKLSRLTDAQWRCHVSGVLALAAKSPLRGYLLATRSEQVTEDDVARQSGKPRAVARATLKRLRELEVLVWDEEVGAEYVHDWDDFNPDPKPSDSREAWRDRKRVERERKSTVTPNGHAGRHADVTRDVTPMSRPEVEVEGEVKPPLYPPQGEKPTPPVKNRKADITAYHHALREWAPHPDRPDDLADQAWQAALPALRSLSEFDLWLAEVHPHRLADGDLVLGVPPEKQSWIEDRFGQALGAATGRKVVVVACQHNMEEAA